MKGLGDKKNTITMVMPGEECTVLDLAYLVERLVLNPFTSSVFE